MPEERFHVIEKDGKFWGIQYEDGYTTTYGYGSILNAQHVDPRYCRKPTDATWKGSHLTKLLEKGRIVEVSITTKILGAVR